MAILEKDRQLIALLELDGRMPVAEIARRLNVSRTAARVRLEKLVKNGVIEGFGVRLGDEYLKNQVRALVMIKSSPLKRSSLENTLSKLLHLTSLYSISGSYDLAALIFAQSVSELDTFINSIGQLPGVDDTLSSIILSTVAER